MPGREYAEIRRSGAIAWCGAEGEAGRQGREPVAPATLLDDATLSASAVVANRDMNRERNLSGVNSYARELGFNPIDLLTARLRESGAAAWLDLCCGTGRALIQAAAHLRRAGLADRVTLVGVDLVDAFDPAPPVPTGPALVTASVTEWCPARPFDLITCVHGLHYVGDKLAVLARAAGWLSPGDAPGAGDRRGRPAAGRLVADLDLNSIRLASGRPAGRRVAARLRGAGFDYDPRRHRIGRTGPGDVRLPYTYLGADDRAGANYTGQPAVHSYYAEGAGRATHHRLAGSDPQDSPGGS